jgi:hypothetical protein
VPYADKEKEKKKKHELYLKERTLLKQAKIATGLPLDKRKKNQKNNSHSITETYSKFFKIKYSVSINSVCSDEELIKKVVELINFLPSDLKQDMQTELRNQLGKLVLKIIAKVDKRGFIIPRGYG